MGIKEEHMVYQFCMLFVSKHYYINKKDGFCLLYIRNFVPLQLAAERALVRKTHNNTAHEDARVLTVYFGITASLSRHVIQEKKTLVYKIMSI